LGWLDGLSSALTAGTQGAAGYLEGQDKGRLEAQARARQIVLDLLAQRKQKEDETQGIAQRANWASEDILRKAQGNALGLRNPADYETRVDPVDGTVTQIDRTAGTSRPVMASGGGNGLPPFTGSLLQGTVQPNLGIDNTRQLRLGVKPTAPLPGSPEWRENEQFKASLNLRSNTYVTGIGEDGNPEIFAATTKGPPGIVPMRVRRPPTATNLRGAIAQQKAMAETEQQGAMVDHAIASVKDNSGAFGVKNYLPDFARERLASAPKDAETLASLEAIVGELRHARFGGALTALEANKAARIFSDPTSPPDVILAKLSEMKQMIGSQKGAQAANFSAKPGGLGTPPPSGVVLLRPGQKP